MAGKETSNGHTGEIIAPHGTYEFLKGIENGRLGSNFTWRKVIIVPVENNPENLDVLVRVITGRKRAIHYVYTFEITPDDRVKDLKGERRQLERPRRAPLFDFNFSEVLGEIQTARMLQPTLR